MPDTMQLDRTFHFIMKTFVERGGAPHYTEIAKEFFLKPGEGRQLLHELMGTGKMPMWLYPGTDPIRILVRDGIIESQIPLEICAYTDIPLSKWARNWPFT
jgi:hypothetical protein